MLESQAIFKIGGKIIENHQSLTTTISQLTSLYERNILYKIILIAGGGSYANFIRLLDQTLHIGNDISHWMAIYTMDLNGKKISRYFPRIKKTKNFEEIEKIERDFIVFLPYKSLRQNDVLPHSWDITSDSITLYLASKLNLKVCYLIKDVDGILNNKHEVIKNLNNEEFLRLKNAGNHDTYNSKERIKRTSKPIDSCLFKLINKYRINCIILNGTSSSLRILKYFKIRDDQNKVYTKLNYN
jgi:aspartokinase-like uncharacterized kinase